MFSGPPKKKRIYKNTATFVKKSEHDMKTHTSEFIGRVLALLVFLTAGSCCTKPAYNNNFIWIESGANFKVLSDTDSIHYYMQKIKDAGFDNVVVETKAITGEVMYQSDLAPYFGSYNGTERPDGYDMFAHVLESCHSLGMRAFAGINVFSGGHNHIGRGIIFNEHPEWQTICWIGGEFKPVTEVRSTYDGMVNAADPEVQEYELAVLEEFVRKYPGCDGIILDRVRFESMVADYSEVSREEFRKWSGINPGNWPEDVLSWRDSTQWSRGRYFNRWCEWRASVIHDFMVKMYSSLKAINPDLIIGDYAGAWYPLYYQVGVNWASSSYDPSAEYDWATGTYHNTGYAGEIDLLMTGLYYTEITEDERPDEPYYTVRGGAEMVRKVTCGEVPLVGSIYTSMYDGDMSRFPDAIRQAVESTGGVMVFDLVHIRHLDLWDALKEGLETENKQ